MITSAEITTINGITENLCGKKAHTVERTFGSFLSFMFGNLVEIEPGYERSDLLLWIQHAGWRLETETEVIVGCQDQHTVMDPAVKLLENVAIVSFVTRPPSLDSTMTFENGMRLRLFPTISAVGRDSWLMWDLFLPDGMVFAIDSGNRWRYQPSAEP